MATPRTSQRVVQHRQHRVADVIELLRKRGWNVQVAPVQCGSEFRTSVPLSGTKRSQPATCAHRLVLIIPEQDVVGKSEAEDRQHEVHEELPAVLDDLRIEPRSVANDLGSRHRTTCASQAAVRHARPRTCFRESRKLKRLAKSRLKKLRRKKSSTWEGVASWPSDRACWRACWRHAPPPKVRQHAPDQSAV